jgi:hypothetical protein
MQACLKLHHSTLQNRRINVELTAGGGGKSDARQGKIKERNDRVGGQRERRAEREKEAEAANGGPVIPTIETDAPPAAKRRQTEPRGGEAKSSGSVQVVDDAPVLAADGSAVKVRGGRRTKAKPSVSLAGFLDRKDCYLTCRRLALPNDLGGRTARVVTAVKELDSRLAGIPAVRAVRTAVAEADLTTMGHHVEVGVSGQSLSPQAPMPWASHGLRCLLLWWPHQWTVTISREY